MNERYAAMADAPGLGLKLNREAVAKYTQGERLFD